jgi:hypothetical protein
MFLILCRNLPYSVTNVEALAYEEIQKKLNSGIRRLQDATLTFLHRIVESRRLIPYGMLYIAKVLHNTLMEKFPSAPEKEILKVLFSASIGFTCLRIVYLLPHPCYGFGKLFHYSFIVSVSM